MSFLGFDLVFFLFPSFSFLSIPFLSFPSCSTIIRVLSLQVVLNITNTFDSSFSRWTVGLGLEHQLNELRVAAGLEEEARFRTRARNLDYAQLVQPQVTLLHLDLLLALQRHNDDQCDSAAGV